MTSFADEFNPDQTSANPVNPLRYDQITRSIERLSPDAVMQLG